MCRFTLYLGPPITLGSLLTEPSHSLIKQSFQSRERDEPLNGDGFGVAFYVPAAGPEPAIFRSISPAWSNRNLLSLARVTQSPTILAHVRAATQGTPVIETNCHPFTRGRLAFAHNGDVGGFHRFRRSLVSGLSDAAFSAIEGSTDSEHLFALFLDALDLQRAGTGEERLLAALRLAFARVQDLANAAGTDEPSYLNVAVTDGERAVVSRFTSGSPEDVDSLYLSTGRRYVCEDGLCRMVDPERGEETVIISSERLSDEPGWQPVPVNHAVVVRPDRHAAVVPLAV
jgi:predicted glutamine amidotransferase